MIPDNKQRHHVPKSRILQDIRIKSVSEVALQDHRKLGISWEEAWSAANSTLSYIEPDKGADTFYIVASEATSLSINDTIDAALNLEHESEHAGLNAIGEYEASDRMDEFLDRDELESFAGMSRMERARFRMDPTYLASTRAPPAFASRADITADNDVICSCPVSRDKRTKYSRNKRE